MFNSTILEQKENSVLILYKGLILSLSGVGQNYILKNVVKEKSKIQRNFPSLGLGFLPHTMRNVSDDGC